MSEDPLYNMRRPMDLFVGPGLANTMDLELAKPPLGLMPHHCWVYRRISEIMRAIIRYEDAGKPVPSEWCDELRAHLVASNPTDQRAGEAGSAASRC